jgi:hypothetical protein
MTGRPTSVRRVPAVRRLAPRGRHLAVVAGAGLLVGCGGSDDGSEARSATSAAAPTGQLQRGILAGVHLGEPTVLRYPGTSVGLVGGQVFLVMLTADGARIGPQATMGDPLASMADRFPRLKCRTASDAHGRDTFPYCTGRLAPHRYLYIGGDPVTSAAVATVPLQP